MDFSDPVGSPVIVSVYQQRCSLCLFRFTVLPTEQVHLSLHWYVSNCELCCKGPKLSFIPWKICLNVSRTLDLWWETIWLTLKKSPKSIFNSIKMLHTLCTLSGKSCIDSLTFFFLFFAKLSDYINIYVNKNRWRS